jgi:hypothetical protein
LASFSTPAWSAARDFWSKAISFASARTTSRDERPFLDLVNLPC